MTDDTFNIEVETHYINGTAHPLHQHGGAEINLVFDSASREAFFEWLAGGCEGTLEISKGGCRFRQDLTPTHYPPGTVLLTTESNKTLSNPYPPTSAPVTWGTSQITCNAGEEAQK